MGTPGFAVPVLSSLVEADHQVVGVYTRPDRPAGRGKRLASSEVKRYALERGLPVFQPASLRRHEAAVVSELESLSPEVIVVAAYGLFLPGKVLALPRLACLNVHPSLLPKYRGPSPVASAILNGDDVTGVTIMQVDEGMDSGPIIEQRATPIAPEETSEQLTERLFELGASLLLEVLPEWNRGEIRAAPQDPDLATVTRRLSRDDGVIDWTAPADRIAREVRAYSPWPGSVTHWGGRMLKIVEATSAVGPPAAPGRVGSLDGDSLPIGTGDGQLKVHRLQLEGRRQRPAAEFVQGQAGLVGSTLGPGQTETTLDNHGRYRP